MKPLLIQVLPFLLIAIVLAFRFRSMSKEQPLKLERLWIVPAILVALAAITLWTAPPTLLVAGYCVLALVVGSAIGWYRGKTIAIHRDPQSGQLMQKASVLGMLVIAGIVILKMGARQFFGPAADPGSAGHNPAAMMASDIFLAFGIGLLGFTRIELYLRARRIIAAVHD